MNKIHISKVFEKYSYEQNLNIDGDGFWILYCSDSLIVKKFCIWCAGRTLKFMNKSGNVRKEIINCLRVYSRYLNGLVSLNDLKKSIIHIEYILRNSQIKNIMYYLGGALLTNHLSSILYKVPILCCIVSEFEIEFSKLKENLSSKFEDNDIVIYKTNSSIILNKNGRIKILYGRNTNDIYEEFLTENERNIKDIL
jgi:hypothetical protein